MSDSVATTALIVSFVALFTTLSQVLQQYLATADGYRRCQSSVMGLWSKKTKLRWRWAEFRFETTFVIPRIIYRSHLSTLDVHVPRDGECPLLNSQESLDASMCKGGWYGYQGQKYYDSDELACWVPLLAQLHEQGAQSMAGFVNTTTNLSIVIPAVQFIRKSWDFMPPDIIRPMASSTVWEVAVMARRMGMIWKDFDPATSLRAEGNGHVFTSTVARSFGIILQYTFTSRTRDGNCFYIPAVEADKLGFGRVTQDSRLIEDASVRSFDLEPKSRSFDLEIGSSEAIERTLFTMIKFEDAGTRKQVRTSLADISSAIKRGAHFIPGLNDIPPFCSPMLVSPRLTGKWMDRIPSPNDYSRGVTSSRDSLLVFKWRVEKLVLLRGTDASEELKTIESYLKILTEERFLVLWNRDHISKRQALSTEFQLRSLLIEYHDEMTYYLRKSKLIFLQLVTQHILVATIQRLEGWNEWSSEKKEYLPNFEKVGVDPDDINWTLAESVDKYFNDLPTVIHRVLKQYELGFKGDKKTDFPTYDEVADAWLAMMLRGFCWQRCHNMLKGISPLPSEYWNSKMPVYIG